MEREAAARLHRFFAAAAHFLCSSTLGILLLKLARPLCHCEAEKLIKRQDDTKAIVIKSHETTCKEKQLSRTVSLYARACERAHIFSRRHAIVHYCRVSRRHFFLLVAVDDAHVALCEASEFSKRLNINL